MSEKKIMAILTVFLRFLSLVEFIFIQTQHYSYKKQHQLYTFWSSGTPILRILLRAGHGHGPRRPIFELILVYPPQLVSYVGVAPKIHFLVNLGFFQQISL